MKILIALMTIVGLASSNSFALTVQERSTLNAAKEFGLAVTKEVVKKDLSENKNTLLSPVSLSLALSMLYNGANAKTKLAMEKAMNLEGISVTQLNQGNQALIQSLEEKARLYKLANANRRFGSAGDPLKINIANALWSREGIVYEKPFINALKKYYAAEASVFTGNLQADAAAVNSWADKNTNGKISQVITSDALRDLEMLLANATYFKASWTNQFMVLPGKHNFSGLRGPSKIEAIRKTEKVQYYEDAHVQVARLDYVGNAGSMYVVLPKGSALAFDKAQEDILTDGFWRKVDSKQKRANVQLTMPKFKFKYGKKLNDALESIGMANMFTNVADFSGITRTTSLKVSFVKQDSFIQLDEKGTEAAAVTTIGMERTTAIPEPITPVKMDVDKPFIIAIRDNASGSFLFIGSIVNPEWN